jgi:Ser/Thr protein kinase RdoA (MazF antagonist)
VTLATPGAAFPAYARARMPRKPDVDAQALVTLLERVFGTALPVGWSRAPEGISTQVYRLERDREVFYLRVGEDAEQSLVVEAELQRELRRRGASVPEVIFVEPFDPGLGRSVLIMRELAGAPLAPEHASAAEVLRAAGRDLAIVHQLPVQGFGWVRRDQTWPLAGELSSYAELVSSYLPAPWPGRLAQLWPRPQLDALERLVEDERGQPYLHGQLAHGDFDATQVFEQHGRYTGIIDFGDIRGTEPCFDLGHFHLWHGARSPGLLAHLLDGYRERALLPADHLEAIARSALLLGLRQLCRWMAWMGERALDDAQVRARVQRLGELLAERRGG